MEIKGLKPYQRRALKKHLAEVLINGDFVIRFNDSISLRRLHCLWYGGNVLDVVYKSYTFHIEAAGDVYADLYMTQGGKHLCYVKDKNNGACFCSVMSPFMRSDRTLFDSMCDNPKSYRLELQHNNWWECFVTDAHGVFHDLMWALDADDLFGAVAEVLDGLDYTIKGLEGAA